MVLNLNLHTFHFEIAHERREICVKKVKILNALETIGFAKGPSHDITQALCKGRVSYRYST